VAVAVENQQIREWYSDSNKPRVELVVDGRQYLATDGAPALSPRVPLGQSYAMILDLSPQQWHSANDGAPLKLGSGQHTVSAVLVAYTSRDAAEQPVRIFSKPVEIEGVGPSRRN
jgi:hypothetical protein